MNALQAVTEARQLCTDLSAKVLQAGGKRCDLAIIAVFAKSDNLGKKASAYVLGSQDAYADSSDLRAVQQNMRNVAVGFLVCVLDREAKEYIVSMRPLILQDPAVTLLDAIAEQASHLEGMKSFLN